MDRRSFVMAVAQLAAGRLADVVGRFELPDNKRLHVILNNDINNLLLASSGRDITTQEYTRAVEALLEPRPVVLAQNVGLPDPVIYRSQVATSLDKYLTEVTLLTWPKEDPVEMKNISEVQAKALRALFRRGTDPLQLTIDECRRRGVFVMASYRMNSEDWYQNTWELSAFGRAHPQSRILNSGALDPADPAVYAHRKEIFREMAEKYDIDGIEFDYMRWTHMVSNPHQNHSILTREVSDTRRMLDEMARRKGRKRLLLGARVGYSLDGPPAGKSDFSCKDLGLDVETWIREGWVDYLCPSYFWPRLPGLPNTAEFTALAKKSRTGIYPTLFPLAKWQDDPKQTEIGPEDKPRMKKLRDELCSAALEAYADGADGISTFNWVHHHQPGMVHKPMREDWGLGSKKVQMQVHGVLGSPQKLRECASPKFTP